ncbi:MAG: TonB-dependent receptor [Methylacidiphilales bacterium]|nr:TonB-dependent receptor [Candidatus Methylacidiphilales bacterium]
MQNPQQFHHWAYFSALLFVSLTLNIASAQSLPPAQTASTAPTPAASVASTSNQPAAKPATLPTIVVTAATLTPQSPDTTAATITVLTHQDLEDGLYASVPDALQSVPGINVVVSGMPGGETSLFSHGMDSNQTLLTIDGRRQSAGLYSSMDNLANLTLDNVNQIEIVRTPVSSAQGGGAMGGVVNIVTLTGQGLSTPVSSVSEEMGSFNTFKENAQSRGAVGNFDYAVSASRQDSIYPSLSPGFPDQADQYRNTAYRGNFGYQITPDIYLDLHTAYNNAYTSLTGSYAFPDPTANLLIEDWNLSPGITAKVTDFYTIKAYYTHDQFREAYVDPYNYGMAIAYDYSPQGDITRTQINTDSVDWLNDFQIAHNWSITAGIQGDNRDFYIYDNGLGYDTADGHNNNIGGYISSQWQPLPGLNILNSGRYDAYSQFGGAFTWRQAVAYTIAPTQTNVHASVSRAFTPPPLQDLYLSYPAFGYYANPNLMPETDLGWEAGVEQPLWDDRVKPSVTYFHNDIKNDIGNVSLGGGNVMLENINQATTDGVEVGLAVKPCSTVTAKIDYTYLNAVNDATQQQLIRRPHDTFQFTTTWQPINQLTLYLGGNWVLGRQDDDAFTGLQVGAADYFILRGGATYRINDTVSIWVRGENLTDDNYQPVLGYYAPSIAGYGGIKISF